MPEGLPDIMFYFVMALVGAGWLALILFPARPWANFWFAGLVVPVLLGVLYAMVMLVFWFQPPTGNARLFFSLNGLARLFENKGLLLAAWIDLTMMPLIVGAWITRRAAQVRLPYVYLLVCLVVTKVLPGAGFALFVVIVGIGGRWKDVAKFEGIPSVDSAVVEARPGAMSA